MNEKREFHRVRFRAKCELTHNEITYHGQLENISLNGALISFNDGVVVPEEEECILTIHLDDEETPLRVAVEVKHSNFTMIGIKFFTCNEKMAQERLFNLMERLSAETDKPGKGPLYLFRDSDG
jgi:hypothetical protein